MKAFIQTYGCQMNEHDSQRMRAVLESIGYEITHEPAEASLILVNTCSVRRNPENKVFSFLGALHPYKKDNPDVIIGVAGCVAQQLGEDILRRNADVDLVFGPDQYFRLPDMLDAVQGGRRLVATDWAPHEPRVQEFIPDQWVDAGRVINGRSSIAIMKGCDNYCSFCIVPFVRGREVSRSPESIVREANALIEKGAKEIWLLGQNVNSYKANGKDFLYLLDAISQLPLLRVRFTSPHPKDWSPNLTQLLAGRPTISKYVHLPLQSASDRVLKLMNRRHNVTQYRAIVQELRRAVPNVEISTDIIAGFPTETEEDFAETLAMLEEVRYSQVFSFMYSPRPGTKAAELEDDVPREVKDERLQRIIATQAKIDREDLTRLTGSRQTVLIDGVHPRDPEVWSGRTDGYRPVSVHDTGLHMGDLINVRITGFRGHWLEGRREDAELPHAPVE